MYHDLSSLVVSGGAYFCFSAVASFRSKNAILPDPVCSVLLLLLLLHIFMRFGSILYNSRFRLGTFFKVRFISISVFRRCAYLYDSRISGRRTVKL